MSERVERLAMMGAACLLTALCAFSLWLARGGGVPEATPDQVVTAMAGGTAMEEFLMERTQIREMEMRQLNSIIEGESTSEAVRAQAQGQLLELCDWMEKETTIEGVLRVRGYGRAVVTVHGDSVNVLVEAEDLSQTEAEAILELVTRETGLLGGNVKIIPVRPE